MKFYYLSLSALIIFLQSCDNEEQEQIETNVVEEIVEEEVDPLEAYTTDLNERARSGDIDPLIGRKEEVDRMIHILARRRKNNPLLVGDAGVGKTAIVEGLALKIVGKKVPEFLQGVTIYALEMGSLLAGTRYRGDFEARFKGIIESLKERDDAILFVDEMHMLIGAGGPYLGVLRCCGAFTLVI